VVTNRCKKKKGKREVIRLETICECQNRIKGDRHHDFITKTTGSLKGEGGVLWTNIIQNKAFRTKWRFQWREVASIFRFLEELCRSRFSSVLRVPIVSDVSSCALDLNNNLRDESNCDFFWNHPVLPSVATPTYLSLFDSSSRTTSVWCDCCCCSKAWRSF
jgi:hypothetical protein